MKKEIWVAIPGTDGKYEVSIDMDEVRCRNTNYRNTGKTRIFTSKPNKKDGRLRWTLHVGGEQVCQQAAYWVAITYPELVQNEWFPGAQIDHIDGTMNNHPSNLRWTTPKENTNNPVTKTRVSELRKGRKLTDEHKRNLSTSFRNRPDMSIPVAQKTLDGKSIMDYPSAAEASRVTGISRSHISLVCQGKRFSAGGYRWSFK